MMGENNIPKAIYEERNVNTDNVVLTASLS